MSGAFVRARIRHYARLMGLGYVPIVVFTEKDWQRHVPRRSRKDAVGCAAVAETGVGVIYVNLARGACCRRSADDTAAHEVLHLARPALRHGKRFDWTVDCLIRGAVPE